ncbi:MAG: transposase [Acidobacteriota bacterium]|nr:transposase [Acidobacteriota bacterium]
MAIPSRRSSQPGTYFVTSRTWQSRRIFQLPAACGVFVDNLMRHRDDKKCSLHAFVVMPDHFHALLTPTTDLTLERVVQLVKGGSSHALGETLQLRFPVWQRGFTDHRIRDVADFDGHVNYIHMNPMKEGLVSEAEQYPWSSASGRWPMDEFPQRLKPLRSGVAGRHD